jgi:cold shock protein
MTRLSGTVKWFDAKKGFGFIVGPEGKDVFVHFSSIEGDGFRTLKDGELVEYELTTGDKGLHAKAVKRKKKDPAIAVLSDSASAPAAPTEG